MPSLAKLVLNEPDVSTRLAELGLTVEILHTVARHYGIILAGMTEDHPSWGVGITPASEAVFALRQKTRPLGWARSEDRGFALTIHPEGLLAINVAKGDEHTGDREHDPQSSSEKGVCTDEAVLSNQLSFAFFDSAAPKPLQTSRRPTWYLLLRRSGNKILCELSLPVEMSEDHHIARWAERILLRTVRLDEPSELVSTEDVVEVSPSVSRRS